MEEATLADLKPDQGNARAHNSRNVGMIVDALQEVGAARSIVVDEEGRILAGNATVEAAATAGIERVRIIDADGEELIAVRRSGLTDEQKKRLAYFDNRTAEVADWDPEQVARDLAEGFDFDRLFYDWEVENIAAPQDGPNDPNAEWQGMPEFENEEAFGAVHSIKVHFASEEDIAVFAGIVGQTVTPRMTFIWYPKQERENLKAYIAHDEP